MSIAGIQREIARCTKCPELRAYCSHVAQQKRRAYAQERYWGKPVPAFGDPNAALLLVGLAPGAHGSNRTGRMFTGDASGDFLYPALHRAGFASQPRALDASDGMQLRDCLITAAQRCAPPGNKPTPAQLHRCFPYLARELGALKRVRVIIGLGLIGAKAARDALVENGFTIARFAFGHGAEMRATNGSRDIVLICSYHPSRQNTNTGKLTVPMFDRIFARARELLA